MFKRIVSVTNVYISKATSIYILKQLNQAKNTADKLATATIYTRCTKFCLLYKPIKKIRQNNLRLRVSFITYRKLNISDRKWITCTCTPASASLPWFHCSLQIDVRACVLSIPRSALKGSLWITFSSVFFHFFKSQQSDNCNFIFFVFTVILVSRSIATHENNRVQGSS